MSQAEKTHDDVSMVVMGALIAAGMDSREAVALLTMATGLLLAQLVPKDGDKVGSAEAALASADYTLRRLLRVRKIAVGKSPYPRPENLSFDPALDLPEEA